MANPEFIEGWVCVTTDDGTRGATCGPDSVAYEANGDLVCSGGKVPAAVLRWLGLMPAPAPRALRVVAP
jgi:hypothetical protein